MHIVFVCTLCVLGGFLITYRGNPDNLWESRVSNFAGYCAFGVAAFPTQFNDFILKHDNTNQYLQLCTDVTSFWGGFHFACAGLLFACFVIFCLVFFQIADDDYSGEELKKFYRRKKLYKICGWGILGSIISLVFVGKLFPERQGLAIFSTFIFETTSLLFFGTAWLVKGSKALKSVPILKKIINPIR